MATNPRIRNKGAREKTPETNKYLKDEELMELQVIGIVLGHIS